MHDRVTRTQKKIKLADGVIILIMHLHAVCNQPALMPKIKCQEFFCIPAEPFKRPDL